MTGFSELAQLYCSDSVKKRRAMLELKNEWLYENGGTDDWNAAKIEKVSLVVERGSWVKEEVVGVVTFFFPFILRWEKTWHNSVEMEGEESTDNEIS